MRTAAKSLADSLSPNQREILRLLLPHGADGMRVKELRGPGPKTAANRAVFSRSVRRLARRGLVIPCNFRHGVQHGPTHHAPYTVRTCQLARVPKGMRGFS